MRLKWSFWRRHICEARIFRFFFAGKAQPKVELSRKQPLSQQLDVVLLWFRVIQSLLVANGINLQVMAVILTQDPL